MINNFIIFMSRRWILVLSLVAFILMLVNVLIFLPGYMSPDSIDSLDQAYNPSHLHDWHPPVFAILWRILIRITGTPTSILFFQLGMQWLMLLLLSIYTYRKTRIKKLSIMVLLLGLLPMVIAVSGVIWKDVHMALVFGLAATLVLILREHVATSKQRRAILLVTILVLIGWAFSLRYNAIFATIPLVYLALRSYGGVFLRSRIMVMSIILLLTAMIAIGPIVGVIFNVRSTNPISAIMFDDIIHVVSTEDLRQSKLPNDLKNATATAQITCRENNIVINGYIGCTDNNGKTAISSTYYRELKSYWFKSLIDHPVGYLTYRIHAFSLFVFAPADQAYVWQDGVVENSYGQHVTFKELGEAARVYVVDFGYRHFSFLFEAWFWLVASVVLIFYSRRFKYNAQYITHICLSAMIYILTYAPVVVAADYRYIYWAVIAILIAGVVVGAERVSRRHPNRID